MARKRRNKTTGGSEIPEAPAEVAEAPQPEAGPGTEEIALDDEPSEEAAADEETPFVLPPFDPARSEAALSACAGIFSIARIASTEAVNAAGPFFSFAQKSRLAGLATRFETARMAQGGVPTSAPAPAAAARVVQTDGLSREEIEGIISHRLEIAVHDALAKLGVSPDETINHQVEKTVAVQLATQEQRLLEYVKRHLTDSLEMLEGSLDERIAEFLEGEGEGEVQRAEVDAQVEEAREALLKNIDEVRTVETGFDMSLLDIAGIAEMTDRISNSAQIAIADEDIAYAAGADEDDEEVFADEDDEEVEAEAEEAEAEEAEAQAEEAEAEAEVEEAALAEAEEAPVEIADDEIEIADDEVAEVEIEVAEVEVDADLDEASAADAGGEIDFDSMAAQELDDYVEVEGGADDDSGDSVVEIETSVADEDAVVELDDLPLEEISIIEPVSSDDDDSNPTEEIELRSADLVEADGDETEDAELADEIELEDEDEDEDGEQEEAALLTLGSGPQDLQVQPVEDLVEIEIAEDESIEVEADDDGSTDEEAIARYLQRAQEMRGRRQGAAAMELYSKVVDLDPDNYEARIGRGVLSLEAKDYKRAVEEFTAAEKIDGSRPASALGLAEVHFHRKQFNKAIRHYTQCLKLDDQLAQAYCNRGLSYYYQKNYKKAFLDLMRAYDLDPGLPNIKKYLKLVRNKVKSDKSIPGSPTPTE